MKARLALLLAPLAVLPAAAWEMPKLPSNLDKIVDVAKDVKAATSTPEADEERALGQDVAATLLGASKPVANPALQQYVNRVGLWVALQGSRPELPWRFAVLDNANVNAFAAPGGYVFITKGLLDLLQSEAELAGVLGHEIAHVERKHHLHALQKEAKMKLAGRGATALLNRSGGQVDQEQLGKIAGVAKGLYTRGLDKNDEFDADRLGAILAARAGYDPYGLMQVLQTLDSVNADQTKMALLFKTHPKPADRLAQLSTSLGGAFDALGERPSLGTRFVATVKR